MDTTGAGFVDRLGSRNDTNGFGPTPDLRFNLGLTWMRGPHLANITLRHIDSYENDEVATLPKIKAWTTLDVHYAHTFDGLFGSGATLYLGANNVAGNDPPGLPTGREGLQRYNLRPGFDGFVHDIKGRVLYVRFPLSVLGEKDAFGALNAAPEVFGQVVLGVQGAGQDEAVVA